ncbi:YolD-like family protein [Paenibacillus psychroresistens]|uniref:YolD-like family protein n=1 Tax=Paenibacillus psychroresistens TaxID=1778678 RepID=A0A6B8RKR4_9BACL|nr:YolD-like family protein [Paenibacillus psychroresistens]QGQ96143.1 YolD-like family protein [Paenibacillus psychroresistens]
MSKKLEKNGQWESSRMMLPEHREAILEQNRSLKKKVKPEMDEQVQEEILRAIGVSMWLNLPMTFVLYDEIADYELTGIAVKIDTSNRMVKVREAADESWIKFVDIVGVH